MRTSHAAGLAFCAVAPVELGRDPSEARYLAATTRARNTGRVSLSEQSLAQAEPRRLAVVDIGSNSSRVIALAVHPSGHLEVLETLGAPLRLVHELASSPSFSDTAVQRTIDVLRGFQALARGAGADRTITVATSAVREADNGEAFVERLERATGLEVRIIDGDEEARYGFLGAVCCLPAEDGVVLDVGGGSVQVVQFEGRREVRAWSLPLGSLRLSDRFLFTDPPTSAESRALVDCVHRTLAEAGVPQLGPTAQVVGTGGTIRNLAKIDRQSRSYPIPRLHGYVLTAEALREVAALLSRRSAAKRVQVPGLNPERFDSIVGGALCVKAVMDTLGATELVVSGRGMREGVALSTVVDALPPVASVRAAGLAAFGARFATWDVWRADLRRHLATRLADTLDPGAPPPLRAALEDAAWMLDVGRSVGYYGGEEHAADMLLTADLPGFFHRAIALMAVTIRLSGKPGASLKPFAPLVTTDDQASLARTAAILALADAIARQAPPGTTVPLSCAREKTSVVLAAPWLEGWPLSEAVRYIQQVFALRVRVDPRATGGASEVAG